MGSLPSEYPLYGLRLSADRPIPGLTTVSPGTPADVYIHFSGREHGPPVPDGAAWETWSDWIQPDGLTVRQCWARAAEGTYRRLRYQVEQGFAQFVVDPTGRHVWATLSPEACLEGLTTVLVLEVLVWVLRVRGVTCLHASAVTVGERAIALVGHRGVGKSTTAAALLQREGCRALADDVAVLTEDGGRLGRKTFLVQPSHPVLRLWPDAARTLLGSSDARDFLARSTRAGQEKRSLDLVRARMPTPRHPAPLAGIYLLGAREPATTRPSIAPLGGVAGLMALTPHAHASNLPNKAERARDFAALGLLATTVPLRRVSRPDGLENLRAICDAILDDARALATLTSGSGGPGQ